MNTHGESERQGTIWKSCLSDRGRNGAFCSLGCSADLFLKGKGEGGRTQETDTGIPGHKGPCGRV